MQKNYGRIQIFELIDQCSVTQHTSNLAYKIVKNTWITQYWFRTMWATGVYCLEFRYTVNKLVYLSWPPLPTEYTAKLICIVAALCALYWLSASGSVVNTTAVWRAIQKKSLKKGNIALIVPSRRQRSDRLVFDRDKKCICNIKTSDWHTWTWSEAVKQKTRKLVYGTWEWATNDETPSSHLMIHKNWEDCTPFRSPEEAARLRLSIKTGQSGATEYYCCDKKKVEVYKALKRSLKINWGIAMNQWETRGHLSKVELCNWIKIVH